MIVNIPCGLPSKDETNMIKSKHTARGKNLSECRFTAEIFVVFS